MDRKISFPAIGSGVSLGSGHYSVQPAGWSFRQHVHQGCELLYCDEGVLHEWVQGEAVDVAVGQWLVIMPGVTHSTINVSGQAFAYFSVHFDLLDSGMRHEAGAAPYIHIRQNTPALRRLFGELNVLFGFGAAKQNRTDRQPRPALKAADRLAFQAAFLLILREIWQLSAAKGPHAVTGRPAIKPAEIELARTIERRLQDAVLQELTIDAIARELYISRSHLGDVFKKLYGIAPRHYVSLLKMNKAKELIDRGDLSLETIGDRLGYSCAAAFSRQFRRWSGMPPMQYRSRKRAED
ncbi:MAG: helix-turn-helix transcriptional regulator [Paenibacillaceae bacterium]|nr:helix-turn-helix transcriptional regulator [Paenibacillaceae bacterium]